MSVSLGHTLTHPARAVLLQPRLDLVAQGAGPVGPSERLPADAIKVLREIFGDQIDRLPKGRLDVWDASLQPATRHGTGNGTIFYDPTAAVWRAAVSPAILSAQARSFPDPRRFEAAVKLQENLHGLMTQGSDLAQSYKTVMPLEYQEVIGEYVSMRYYKDYFLHTMRYALMQTQGRNLHGYSHMEQHSLHALGMVAEKYGLPYDGSTAARGRRFMQDLIASGASRIEWLTFDFLRAYAKKNLPSVQPEQLITDLRYAFLSTFGSVA